MVAEATAARDEAVNKLRAELDEAEAAQAKKSEAAANAVYAGSVKLSELEAGKILLRAKQDCVAAVYDAVRERILSLKDEEYLRFIRSLIAEYAEDGDEVKAARTDAKRVTAAWLKKVSTSLKKKLTLCGDYGDFDGGVILRNARYDRDLTVDELVSDLKERTERDTASSLGLN